MKAMKYFISLALLIVVLLQHLEVIDVILVAIAFFLQVMLDLALQTSISVSFSRTVSALAQYVLSSLQAGPRSRGTSRCTIAKAATSL